MMSPFWSLLLCSVLIRGPPIGQYVIYTRRCLFHNISLHITHITIITICVYCSNFNIILQEIYRIAGNFSEIETLMIFTSTHENVRS